MKYTSGISTIFTLRKWLDAITHTAKTRYEINALCICLQVTLNTFSPRQTGHHLADDIFKCVFFKANIWIWIKTSFKLVLEGPFDNAPALIKIEECDKEATYHYLNHDALFCWRIYASIGLNHFTIPWHPFHYDDVIMRAIVSQITSLTIVYSAIYVGADQSKHQSSVSLAFVCRGPVNSPHKWPVTRKMFPFDDVIMLKR